MIASRQLIWYAQRLGRMSGPEVAHRVFEQLKKTSDVRRDFGWNRFSGLEGSLYEMPGLSRASPVDAKRELRSIEAGDFCLLGQRWPSPAGDRPWYAQDGAWHRDPVTGDLWPGKGTFAFQVPYRHERRRGDVKFVWELNRLQILQVLTVADAAEAVPDMLESWMHANPPFEGINWASGLEAASRVLSLLVAFSLMGPSLRRRLDLSARRFLAAHIYWIARYPSLHSSANNHRVAELAALLIASVCAPGLAGTAFHVERSLGELEQVALDLFHSDGVGAEQSPTYAAYSLEWFALAGLAAEKVGRRFSAGVRLRLHDAAAHLRMMMDDTGRVPRIGDDDEGRAIASQLPREDRYVASVVALVGRWLGDAELLSSPTEPHLRDWFAIANSTGAGSDYGGVDARNLRRRSAASIVKTFPHGGYTIARSPTRQGTLVAVFDHGPLGFGPIAAHGHADALAIWLHWGDEPILVDAGTYLYHSGGQDRDVFRRTCVHNTLTVENADQSLIAGPFNWRRHARTSSVERSVTGVSGEHDGYLRRFGVVHRRDLSFKRNILKIDDRLIGRPVKSPLRWSVGFLLGPLVLATTDGPRARLETNSGRTLLVELEDSGLAWEKGRGQYSPAFNCRETLDHLRVAGSLEWPAQELPRIRTTVTASDSRPP